MKTALTKNWVAKIVSLLLATAIWFLIRDHLQETGEGMKAPVPEKLEKQEKPKPEVKQEPASVKKKK